MPAIEVKNLTKTFLTYKKRPGIWGGLTGLFKRDYTETIASSSVNFSITEGELVGFLGPNGAGKTTVLKMLSGLLYPTSGSARVLGYIPWERKNAYRRQFSLVMGQKNQLWWDLPARESFELNREIYGIEHSTFAQKLEELSTLLDVKEKMDVMVRELSLGERMKMELIAALLHSPRILLLDEPTIGLDVTSQKKVREFIREHNQRYKVTILLTSHYMADIEELCQRVIIIDHGKIFFDGKLSEIVNRFAHHKILHLMWNPQRPTLHNHQTDVLIDRITSFGQVLERQPGILKLKVPRNDIAQVCRDLFSYYPIEDINIQEVPIEDVVREIFEKGK